MYISFWKLWRVNRKGQGQHTLIRCPFPYVIRFPKETCTHSNAPPTLPPAQLQFFFLDIFTNSLRISYKGFWSYSPHSQIHKCSSYPNLPLTSCLFLKNKPIKHQNPNCIKVKDDSTGKSNSVTSKPDLLILRNFWIIMPFKIKQHFNLRYPKKRTMYISLKCFILA